MGVFVAFFGCRGDAGFKAPLLGVSRGDAGFSGPLLGASSGVGGFNVAMLSRLVREKVLPVWSDVGVSAKKFALRAQNTPKLAFSRLLGEFFRGNAAGGAALGEYFSRQSALCPGLVGEVAHEAGCGGGFAALEAGWRRIAGVSYL